jgi:hypothetical protein
LPLFFPRSSPDLLLTFSRKFRSRTGAGQGLVKGMTKCQLRGVRRGIEEVRGVKKIRWKGI